jgi:hypothetical protein
VKISVQTAENDRFRVLVDATHVGYLRKTVTLSGKKNWDVFDYQGAYLWTDRSSTAATYQLLTRQKLIKIDEEILSVYRSN